MKYRILWRGVWRPVLNLLRGREMVFDPMRATAVVAYVAEVNGYVALEATPAEIFTLPEESRPTRKLWQPLGDEGAGNPDASGRGS